MIKYILYIAAALSLLSTAFAEETPELARKGIRSGLQKDSRAVAKAIAEDDIDKIYALLEETQSDIKLLESTRSDRELLRETMGFALAESGPTSFQGNPRRFCKIVYPRLPKKALKIAADLAYIASNSSDADKVNEELNASLGVLRSFCRNIPIWQGQQVATADEAHQALHGLRRALRKIDVAAAALAAFENKLWYVLRELPVGSPGERGPIQL